MITNKKTNILFIELLEKTSALHLLPILKKLSEGKNFNVVLLGQTKSFLSLKAKEFGIKTYTIKYVEFNVHKYNTYLPFFKTLFLIGKIIRQNEIKIIHCHRLNWAYLGIIASRIFKLPLLVNIVFIEKLTSRIQNYLINHHHNVLYLSVSQHARQSFHDLYHVPLKKIIVYCGGVQIPSNKKNKIPQDAILKKIQNKKIIAMISRLCPSKGVDIFIEAAGLLKEKWPNVYFLFIGHQKDLVWGNESWKQNYLKECQQRIHSLKLEKQFSLLNFDYEINRWYPLFYCTVLPTWLESLGYVALESQAYKKPVIITKVGGTPETVNYGKAGILIPYPPSPIILANKIDKLLSDKKYYQHYSDKGYLWVKNNFDINKNISTLVRIYRQLLVK